MEVCEICGAFLIVGDAQSRVDDHLQGKQHVGYARIKAAVEDMKVSLKASFLLLKHHSKYRNQSLQVFCAYVFQLFDKNIQSFLFT